MELAQNGRYPNDEQGSCWSTQQQQNSSYDGYEEYYIPSYTLTLHGKFESIH